MSTVVSPAVIALVDDSPDDIEIMTRCFLRSGKAEEFRIQPFGSGPDFLHHMGRVEAGDETVPVIVLLDINMPEMDGFETLRSLRSIPAFRTIPTVLFVSNSDRVEDLERAALLNANVAPKFGTIDEGIDFFDRIADLCENESNGDAKSDRSH